MKIHIEEIIIMTVPTDTRTIIMTVRVVLLFFPGGGETGGDGGEFGGGGVEDGGGGIAPAVWLKNR